MGYDINPAFALAPVVAWAFVAILPDRLTIAFSLAAIGGLISISVAHFVSPTDDPIRPILGLILFLIAPSFLFLGRWLTLRGATIERLVFWLAVFATVFLVPVVARLIIGNEPVRATIGWPGYAVLNAEWLTLPVFATFGVISLAYLIALQMVLLAGAMFLKVSIWTKAGFFVGLTCASFMVLGSESRAAQLCVLWLAVTTGLAFLRFKTHRLTAGLIVLAIAISVGSTLWRVPANEMRLVRSAETVFDRITRPREGDRDGPRIEDLSTGRVVLITEGFKETAASPWIGNGFSSYGRYSDDNVEGHLAHNSSTHIFYLTALWKGGLVFALPFFAFLAIAAWRAIGASPWTTPEGFFLSSAILLAFGPMALSWDILYVPSAGALAWLLLGAMDAETRQAT